MGLLKTQGVPEDLEQGARDVAQAAAMTDFVPRVSASAENFAPAADDFAGIEEADSRTGRREPATSPQSSMKANPERDRLLIVAREAESKL